MSSLTYKTARNDKLVSHRRVHTSGQGFNRKQKASKAETQEASHLKCKIPHQEPASSPKKSRLENSINPGNEDLFLKDIEIHENQDHAFTEFLG